MIKRTVRERPILFSGEMVQAILKGRKTQTRRVVTKVAGFSEWAIIDKTIVDTQAMLSRHRNAAFVNSRHCPYGTLGDRLWVRESIRLTLQDVFYMADGQSIRLEDLRPEQASWLSHYGPAGRQELTIPSIHMPWWASRITLEVTGVRVERVQDITKADAIAEGIDWSEAFPEGYTVGATRDPSGMMVGGDYALRAYSATQSFARLWDSLNAKRGYGWDVNPWVWVVEFRQIQPGQQRLPEQKGEG